MFKVGDYIYDSISNNRVQIVEISKVWDYVTYKVFDKSNGRLYNLASNMVTPEEPRDQTDENYLRYVALLAKIKNETSEGILSNLTSGIIPLPHQMHVLNRALSTNNVRYILADEVGLGKTIEAGMIIKELKTRGLIKRILIVCPTGLVTQWGLEMQEKFGEKFHLILPEEYETIRRITDEDDIYGQFDQIISPMDSIKPLEKRAGWSQERVDEYNQERIYSIINSGWDLIIIDEAHRVAGSTGEVARHKLGRMLADASPYLLLLTATPHNGKTEPFLRLIRLVDKKAFPSVQAVVKHQVAPYIIRTEKRETIDGSGQKLFKKRNTRVVELIWDERHSKQRELYELVSRYVSTTYNLAMRNRGERMWVVFLLIMMQRMVTSSTPAIRTSLERRVSVLKEEAFQVDTMTESEYAEANLEDNLDVALASTSLDTQAEIESLETIIALAKQAEYQYLDVKVEPLLAILNELFFKDRNRKVIIFTEFVATQDYLRRLLGDRGYSVSILNGSMNIEERNRVLSQFKEETELLISTDAGGEGLNLQFSDCVINYDLPWNPMKIEQRIGRVDRIGQQRDVEVFNFVLEDTIENRVKNVLEEKLSVILQEIGVDKYADVLDGETAGVNFTNAYMRSIEHPHRIERNIRNIEQDLRTQVENALKTKDLLSEEKDLYPFVGQVATFDLDGALKALVRYYAKSVGESSLPFDHYSISDERIVWHLQRDIEHNAHTQVVSVELDNLQHEDGYFMLWHLTVAPDGSKGKTIPIFVSDEKILRPIAASRIWEAILDDKHEIKTKQSGLVDSPIFAELLEMSHDYAYDTFLEMKEEYEHKLQEDYNKYIYALYLRIEAAQRIGIENIQRSRLTALAREQAEMKQDFEQMKEICPTFRLTLLLRMEKTS